jgi:hypothetical protein
MQLQAPVLTLAHATSSTCFNIGAFNQAPDLALAQC